MHCWRRSGWVGNSCCSDSLQIGRWNWLLRTQPIDAAWSGSGMASGRGSPAGPLPVSLPGCDLIQPWASDRHPSIATVLFTDNKLEPLLRSWTWLVQGDLEAARKEAAERAAERDTQHEERTREHARAERLQEQLEVQ